MCTRTRLAALLVSALAMACGDMPNATLTEVAVEHGGGALTVVTSNQSLSNLESVQLATQSGETSSLDVSSTSPSKTYHCKSCDCDLKKMTCHCTDCTITNRPVGQPSTPPVPLQ